QHQYKTSRWPLSKKVYIFNVSKMVTMARRTRAARIRMSRQREKIGNAIEWGSAGLAFFSQIMAKPLQTNPQFNSLDPMSKAKFTINAIVGQVTGINPFNDQPAFQQNLNPAGMINKFTAIGVLTPVAAKMLRPLGVKVPHEIVKGSKGFLKGGLIGGFFDAPARAGGGVGVGGAIGGSNNKGGPGSRVQGFGGTNTG
ncbi:MAG: hypothetical protein KGH74_05615, partial [Candidatus Micrarchaeota archaeon]|nr:hypothetical protein [Candidatus Micrarchaeota archaeon]